MTYKLTVRVSGGEVEATLDADGVGDANRGKAKIAYDRLRLDTVGLLQQWLGRWQLISEIGAKNKEFPVLTTFRILGQYLYEIVFSGDVNNGFLRSYREAEAAGEPLRVLLSFDEDASELATLPWEFLWCPEDRQSRGFYLATNTKLVLNRFLPGRPSKMLTADLPLRVLFVMCIPPGTGAAQVEQRGDILAIIAGLRDHGDQLVVRLVENWDVDSVEEELKQEPHVVHIIGNARHVRDSAGRMRGEIELPGPDGTLTWKDPQQLMDLLTRGKSPEQLPRLVILHLCETWPIDFTASFERLAPELIKAGIPAVLATQYPISANAARRFTSRLYARLAAGDEIDQIVQDARYDMSSRLNDNRLIGTPVLYMQSVGGRLVSQEAELPSEGRVDPHQVSTRSTTTLGGGIRLLIKKAAWMVATDQESIRAVEEWIDQSDWSDDPAENERRIRQHMLEDPNLVERGPIYLAMIGSLSGRWG
jgi:CHAT domain